MAKITTRQQDAEIAKSLGWRVSQDPWWNWHSSDEEPGFYFDPPGDEWCIRRDGRKDRPCNEPLPDFSEYQKGNT